jgi:HSP90 family molecular chaperone
MKVRKRKPRKKKVPTVKHEWELVNKNKPLGLHHPSKITDDESGEFYESMMND